MSSTIDFDADITASHAGHEIRIHGEGNDISVDAESWTPVLQLRRLGNQLKARLPGGAPPPFSIKITIRGSKVCSIRSDSGTLKRKIHPWGILRSLIGRQ